MALLFCSFRSLLEHFSISPFVCLAVDGDRLIPRPLIVNEGSVLRLGGVKLGEFVGFPVWGNIESWESFVTTNQEGTLNGRIIGDSID